MKRIISFLIFTQSFSLLSQVNLVLNPSFESHTACPNFGADWMVCSNWNNVNLNPGIGSWGTPDYFHTCGINGAAPPATFAGTCSPHTGNAMMAIVLYNAPQNYREYLSTQLSGIMQPGTTYSLSFWLSNGTGIKSPWTIRNIGVCFSSGPLSQSGWGLISATAQCEIPTNVVSTGWTQYTFTVNPTTAWNYLTIGAFQGDANNNPTLSFPNPGGPASAYANYFVDDIQVLAPSCNLTITPTSTLICDQGFPATLTVTGGSGYTWSPSSALSSSTGSVVSASPSITTTYSVTSTSGACITTQTITIVVTPSLFLTTTPIFSLCSGSSITASANGGVTYTWQPGSLNGATVNLSPNVNTIYTVTSTNSQGCTDSQTVSIIVYPNPTISIIPVNVTVCAGAIVTFSQTGSPSYTWQPGNFVSLAPLITLTPTASVIYTVTGKNNFGCTSKITHTITVIPNPTLAILPGSQTACIGSSASFTASGAPSYTWLPTLNTGSVLTVTVPAANVVYTVNASTPQGCTATATVSLFVVPGPTVTASSNPTATCAGGSVTLTANGATNYTWSPGNITGQVVNVNPLTTTIYTVTGVTNGCASTASVVVANPLSPTITSSGNIDCNNASTQIVISANSNTYTILWSGPGITGVVSSSAIITSSAGIYTAVLTDTVTNCSATSTLQVLNTVGNLSLTIIPSYTLACYPGPPLNLLVSTSANYTWFPSVLVTPSVGPLVSVNPQTTTTFTVLATLGVCSGSAAVTISVNPTPTLSIAVNNLTVCSGITTTLSANGASEYNWMPGNIAGASVTVAPLATTIYTVSGKSNNCSSVTNLTVNVLPSPALSASVFPALMCVGDLATLTASGTGTINWLTGGSIVPNSTFVASPFVNTTYTAIATNSLGCSSLYPVIVNVNAGPSLFATSSASLICSYETVSLSASGGVNYTWLPTNQTGNSIVGTPSVSTVYTVIAESAGCKSYTTILVQVEECIQRIFGMTNAADEPSLNNNLYRVNFTVTVVNNSSQTLGNIVLKDNLRTTFSYPCTYTLIQSPAISSSASVLKINSLFDGDSNLSLTDSSSSSLPSGKRDTLLVSVLVDPHDFSGTLKNSVIGFAKFPNTLIVTDSSNNGFNWDPDNDGDPTNNNEVTPIELELIELFIPQGFSPDGDGKYDYFVIKGLNGRQVNITIFNRWGNKVYEKNNYDNTWDGRTNVGALTLGKGQLPEATYYYIVQFQDGKKEVKTGFVVLRYE